MKKKEWEKLSEELKKGNNRVLGIFFQQHSQYCCQRLSRENNCSEDDARDFFIESVMSLRERIVRDPEVPVLNIRAFLYRACYNMFLSALRAKKAEPKPMSDLERYYLESDYHLDENPVFDQELLAITLRAWAGLSERCQDILHFFYVDRLRMKEIARLMGMANEDVAKTTKSRCYKKLVSMAFSFKKTPNIKDS